MKTPVYAITLFAAIALAGCGGSSALPPFDSQILNDHAAEIVGNASTGDTVFVGTVSALGAPPPGWSGVSEAYQGVTYDVVKVLKGVALPAKIEVQHLVVHGSRQAADLAPGLSTIVFKVGNKLIVFARTNGTLYEDFDEDFGTIPDSAMNEKAIGLP